MKYLLAALVAALLAGCAAFSGAGGQYQTVETVEIGKRPTSFYDDVVTVGHQLGYQHTGGNRATNSVNLADQPNFGQTMLGSFYTVQVTAALRPNGRTIDLTFVAVGGRGSAGAEKSQKRIEQLKAALRERFGG